MAEMGRKKKELPQTSLAIILTLVSNGFSDYKVSQITGISRQLIRRTAERSKKVIQAGAGKSGTFGQLLRIAKQQRRGGLSALIANSMQVQIKKGHPWYTKLAIHNFDTGFKDPDIAAQIRLKKVIQELLNREPTQEELVKINSIEGLAQAKPPAGVIPSMPEPTDGPDNKTAAPVD